MRMSNFIYGLVIFFACLGLTASNKEEAPSESMQEQNDFVVFRNSSANVTNEKLVHAVVAFCSLDPALCYKLVRKFVAPFFRPETPAEPGPLANPYIPRCGAPRFGLDGAVWFLLGCLLLLNRIHLDSNWK
ncbi:unnamed protein product [Lymnaea stagnalis]|uniref:Uncharacterized protein n=1 Tax=Lymnaea stagnalis TaxID=6523 RepID=A0AAV2IFB0_LYMST